MPNLSAYINFSSSLNKSPTGSSWGFTDTGTYPSGVPLTLKGYFIITQPDNISIITGSFLSPSIYWNGSQLTTGSFELRLRSTGGFEQGKYKAEYHIIATGYSETVLTKTFTLSYASPVLTVASDFNVFLPSLSVTDNTFYTQAGTTLTGIVRAWQATIISVQGTNHDISASTQSFDLAYLGSYFDSRYDIDLTSTVTYTLASPSNWVTIVDEQNFVETLYAFIPLTIIQLLQLLTTYKAIIDAGNCICGTGCVDNCTTLKNTYTLAVSIYTHIVERGRAGQVDGLDAYVLQLQKLLSNCVTPAYTNTNNAILVYDWGNSGSGQFAFFKQMIVGSGINNAPAAGASSYNDALLIGKQAMVFLDSLLMGNNLSDRITIIYNSLTGTITWNTPLATDQLISIYTL